MNWLDAWHKQDFAALKAIRRSIPADRFHAPWVPGRRVLFVSRKWHLAGSEIYARRWGEDLTRRDFDVTFATTKLALSWTDEHLWNYGAIICVIGSSAEFAHRFYNWGARGPRLVGMVNTAPSSGDPIRISDLLVSNTRVESRPAESLGNVIVLHPPLDMQLVRASRGEERRDAIVQVNLSRREKNPAVFAYLAENMPAQAFIAIRGAYGEQAIPALPNVEVRDCEADAVRKALLSRAKLLLCPSTKESYGMAVAEALSVGVPCIVSDLPGLRECAGDAAIYLDPEDLSSWLRGVKLADTWYARLRANALLRGEALIAQQEPELLEAARRLEWLILSRKG